MENGPSQKVVTMMRPPLIRGTNSGTFLYEPSKGNEATESK